MNEKDYDEQLAKARDFHGHICGGIAIGTKLAMYGLELLGMPLNERHKNLIVFLEIDLKELMSKHLLFKHTTLCQAR